MPKLLQFKTNINCGSCVRSVTPFLDEVEGVRFWRVDVEDERKLLSVEGNPSERDVMAMVRQAGFDIEPIPVATEE